MVLLDPQVHSDTIYGHTQLSVLMCVISSGYFLHDLIIVLMRLDTEGVAMLVHACCCLFVYTYAVYSFYLTFYGENRGWQLHPLQEQLYMTASLWAQQLCRGTQQLCRPACAWHLP